jgi:hypothetical protein
LERPAERKRNEPPSFIRYLPQRIWLLLRPSARFIFSLFGVGSSIDIDDLNDELSFLILAVAGFVSFGLTFVCIEALFGNKLVCFELATL